MKRFAPLALLVSMVLVVSLAVCPRTGLADFGDFAGNSDYGDDAGWDDDDDDYSWGDSSYYDDDDDYSSRESLDFDLNGDGNTTLFEFVEGIVAFLVFACVVVAAGIWWDDRHQRRALKKSLKNKSKQDRASKNQAKSHAAKNVRRGEPIATYGEVDPGFDIVAFGERVSNLYVRMQNAWTDKDIEPVRPFFTAEIYAQMERQLGQMVKWHRTNYVEHIAVLSAVPLTWFQEAGYDHILVEVKTRIVDYTLDDNTGELISGSRTAEKFMTYEWDMSRRSGVTTAEQAELHVTECPNCGASVDINATAKCPYCDSVIEVKHDDWAINSIKGISQRTAGK